MMLKTVTSLAVIASVTIVQALALLPHDDSMSSAQSNNIGQPNIGSPVSKQNFQVSPSTSSSSSPSFPQSPDVDENDKWGWGWGWGNGFYGRWGYFNPWWRYRLYSPWCF
ncbi:hypothetical protein BGX21_010088 [Mortierella sp. AD011]|nr:hypothetical protein BGX20_005272 [Mortierella sp. AD010]KAF9395097.1 hypothetical protein BGX21_010088 [Mortierella sp. AD011]